jgi:hypothetical protein
MTQEEWDLHDKRMKEIEVQYAEAMYELAKDDGWDEKGPRMAALKERLDQPVQRWKCPICYKIVEELPCPECGYEAPLAMCHKDHVCTCLNPISEKIRFCEVCGSAICPCGSHDVEVHTRITGYINALSGFNAGKAQEVKDRVRNVTDGKTWRRVNGKDDV